MKAISFFFLILLSLATKAQTTENVYIHTDKDTYFSGEIVWFKVYTVDSESLKPSSQSSVAYVDIIGQAKVVQAKVELSESGLNGGSIFIPSNIPSGKYELRGYTRISAEQFFSKTITILNPFSFSDSTINSKALTYQVDLFPEGGNLIENLESTIGFKAINSLGEGVKCELQVLDSNNNPIVKTTSNKYGIGSFSIVPKNEYKVVVKTENETTIYPKIPAIEKDGFVLKVTDTGNAYQVKISTSLNHINETVKLSSQTLKINQQGHAETTINKEYLKPGTSLLTLTDETGKPLAERVVFKYPKEKLAINTTNTKQTYATRDEINLKLETATLSDLSIAVRKVDDIQTPPEEDIFTYLYLKKNVTGTIEDPKFYFSESSNSKEIDNLLLTQGWRKFKPTNSSILSEQRYHNISIKYSDKSTGLPVVSQEVVLSVPGKTATVFTAVTNQNGIAVFKVKNLFGTKQLATKVLNGTLSNIELLETTTNHENINVKQIEYANISQSSYDAYGENTQVENAFNGKARAIHFTPVSADSIPFYGKAEVKYRLDDYTRFVIMEEVLREYIKEVVVRKNKDNFHLKVLDAQRNQFFQNDPLMLLDGVPLASANEIINYDPLKVQNIEVVTTRYYLGEKTYDGIVSFSTYKNTLDDFTLDPAYSIFSYNGLQFEREFYSPKLSKDDRRPDNRTMLYWNPRVNVQNTKPSELKFNTSDIKGKYIIDIQGIDVNGKVGSEIIPFKVQ